MGPVLRYRVLLGVMGATLAASALLVACSRSQARPPAPAFELTNQWGHVLSLSDLRGQVVVLTFLYTHCAETCPLYLYKIGQALASSAASDGDVSDVSVVAVTVDPARDTGDHLREAAASWPEGWHFLTGPTAEVARVWGSYSVYVEREETSEHLADHQGYEVVHTAKVVVVDKEGRIAGELKGDWDPAQLTVELAPLLTEEWRPARTDEPVERPLPGGGRFSQSPGLPGPVLKLLQSCGEFAAAHPWLFMGLTALLLLPGVALPAYLLRTFLHTSSRQS